MATIITPHCVIRVPSGDLATQLDLFGNGRPLPARVRVISLHEPYASLVVDSVKTLETRTWAWPYPASWLLIHKAKKVDKHACKGLGLDVEPYYQRLRDVGSGVIGIVWVVRSRSLLPEDEPAAMFYAPNRFAWELESARRFAKLIDIGHGPQKFASVDRERVLDALQTSP